MPMTPEDFKKKMGDLFPHTGYDEEGAHGDADDLMLDLLRQLGYGEGADIFDDASKWYA